MRGGGGQNDQTLNLFIYTFIAVVAVVMLWFVYEAVIVDIVFFIRRVEIDVILGVIYVVNWLTHWVHIKPINTVQLEHWHIYLQTAVVKDVKFHSIEQLSDYVGLWLRFPVAVILMGLSAWLFFGSRTGKYHNNYSMNSLKKTEVNNWPEITPIMSMNLVKTELREGAWAMAQTPIEFSKENDLLEVKKDKEGKKIWSIKQGPAERAMMLQLGSLWSSVDALPIHLKALVVCFLSRAERKNKISDDLLRQIAQSASHGKLDFKGVEEQLMQYKHSHIIKWLQGRHAYVGTLMASLLEVARSDGVLATSEFLWLKPLDRRMWYMLNSVGRQTPVVEVAGLFAQWLAEKRLSRALRAPMLKEAVVALEEAIKNILYREEGDSWRTNRAA